MNKRFVGVLIFAFLVASGASLLLYKFLAGRPQQTAKAAPAAPNIVIAAKDLEAGSVLKEEDLKLEEWPGQIPAGSSGKVGDFVGRGVLTMIYAKEPIVDNRLAAKGAGGGFAAMIPPGMRAVAVRVNEVAGVAGFAVAGMRVDVLISGSNPAGNGSLGTITKTLLQNLEVLSAAQDFKKDPEGKPIVTQVVNLLVTPEQAEQLSLASAQTNIQLVLRNPLDREVSKTTGTAVKLLFDGGKMPVNQGAPVPEPRVRAAAAPVRRAEAPAPPPPPPEKKADPPFTMQIIVGSKKGDVSFPAATGGK
jgi:pilus assembly protein CpaB